jgi:hypothetical protein
MTYILPRLVNAVVCWEENSKCQTLACAVRVTVDLTAVRNFFCVIGVTSKKMRWAGHVAHVGEKICTGGSLKVQTTLKSCTYIGG